MARTAFSELGYAGASMGDIAARSGIRKSSLFHHFATKDDLYREALIGVVHDIAGRVAEAMGGDEPFCERMDRSTIAIQRYFGRNPVAARLLMREFVDGGAAQPAAGDAVDAVLKNTVAVLEDGMRVGAIAKQDPRQLAITMIGVHFLFFATPEVSSRLVGQDVFDEAQVEARARTVCLHLRRLLGLSPQA